MTNKEKSTLQKRTERLREFIAKEERDWKKGEFVTLTKGEYDMSRLYDEIIIGEEGRERRKDLRASGKGLLNKERFRELLKEATIEERSSLLILDEDYSTIGLPTRYTKKEREELMRSIGGEEWGFFESYLTLYSALIKYGEKTDFAYKIFQMDAALLSQLLTKWEGYDRLAEVISSLSAFKEGDSSTREKLLEELADRVSASDVKFRIEGDRIAADIKQEAGLWERIKKQEADTIESFNTIKGYIEAACDYITEHLLYGFTPHRLELMIDNFQTEKYLRTYIDPSFLRSTINDRRAEGETIPPEEEARAIIPDLRETETDPDILEYCKTYIKFLYYGGE